MGKIHVGINLEYVRHEDKPFEWGVKMAAELGFSHVEPMVHLGRELLSEGGYFHSVSMLDDPLRIRRACETYKIKLSGLSAHSPLCKPDISVDYLKQAIRFAAECGAPVINTDEGPKPPWTTIDEDHILMRYTLQEAALVAEPRGILIGLEPHQQYSKHPDGLDRIYSLVKSPSIGINFDTGNSYLCGHDPYAWLERVSRSARASARQGHLGRAIHLRPRQGDRHSGRLCLRRRSDRLVARRCHLPQGPPRHRLLGRVRNRRPGRPVGEAPPRAPLIHENRGELSLLSPLQGGTSSPPCKGGQGGDRRGACNESEDRSNPTGIHHEIDRVRLSADWHRKHVPPGCPGRRVGGLIARRQRRSDRSACRWA